MSSGKILLASWLFALAIIIFFAFWRKQNQARPYGLINFFLLIAFTIVPLLLASYAWISRSSLQDRPALEFDKHSAGTLYEVHTLAGNHPPIAVYMSGFQDASFSAYILREQSQELIFPSLPVSAPKAELMPNMAPPKNHALRTMAQSKYTGLYEVFWSEDGHRFGLAYKGHLLAACDLLTGQKIETKDTDPVEYQAQDIDLAIRRFLEGAPIPESELITIKRNAYLKAVKEMNNKTNLISPPEPKAKSGSEVPAK